jgi:hypothetical protein
MVGGSSLSLACPTPCRALLELMPPHFLSPCIDCPYMLLNLNLNEHSWCPSTLASYRFRAAPSSPFASRCPPNYLPSVTVPLINYQLLQFCVTKLLYNIIVPLLPRSSPLFVVICVGNPVQLLLITM